MDMSFTVDCATCVDEDEDDDLSPADNVVTVMQVAIDQLIRNLAEGFSDDPDELIDAIDDDADDGSVLASFQALIAPLLRAEAALYA